MKRWSPEDLASAKEFREKAKTWTLPLLFTDVVIMTIEDEQLKVLLTQRIAAPERGKWSFPGVAIRPGMDDSVTDAAMRAVKGKAKTSAPYLEQLCDFSGPDRDPRGWSSSYAHLCLMPVSQMHASSAAEAVKLVPVEAAQAMPLAFDHNAMLEAALVRVRNKVNYSSLPAHLLGDRFTLTELMQTYEVILGQKLDKSAFRKKVQEAGFVRPVAGEFRTGANRPAQLFELDKSEDLVVFRRNLTA